MRLLGEQLARAGFTVHGPRLAGHGTDVDDLAATTLARLVRAVEDALDAPARARAERVAVVGQSLGGLLALHLARRTRRRDRRASPSLAAPLWLDAPPARARRA